MHRDDSQRDQVSSQYCEDDEVRVVWDKNLKDARVVGLENRKNFCFANATMQCLASTPMVGNLAITSPLPQTVESTSSYAKFEALICKLRPKASSSDAYVQRKFVDDWVNVYQFAVPVKYQADAPEFLEGFLRHLTDLEYDAQLQLGKPHDFKQETLRTERAFRYYQTKSKICTTCHRQELLEQESVSSKRPLAVYRSGTFAERKNRKQDTSIMDFLTDTWLDKRETICQCNADTEYSEIRFLFPPNNLILNIDFEDTTVTLEKTLDIQRFVDAPPNSAGKTGENHQYELHGILVYEKCGDGGHYIAYVQNMKNEWYTTSDSTSTLTDWDAIKTRRPLPSRCENDRQQGSHLLFYHRTSPNLDAFPQNPPTPSTLQTKEGKRRVGLLRLRQKLQRGGVVSRHTFQLTEAEKNRLGNRLQDVAPMPIEEFIATPRNQTRARPLQAGGP
jgi:ubiquitin C-terminal hydrolase